MDSITGYLSEYAVALGYEDLDPETVRQTKIRFVDSMGCGVAAFTTPVGRIVRAVASVAQGRPGSSVLGTSHRSSPELAAFANSAMVRFLDHNDTYHSLDSGHPSDMIPGVLALAEASSADGKTAITATVLGYEVFCRLCDVSNIGWGEARWYNATWGAISSAVAAAKVLGLSPEQTANAISIAVVSHAALNVITRGEHVPLWHPCADPNGVRQGVFAALLAKEGMEAPPKPFEDSKGFFEVISGPFHLPQFGGRATAFRINDTLVKKYAACSHLQTAAEAAVQVHRQMPPGAEIAEVLVTTNSHTVEVCVRPDRWHPKGPKSAQLSLPYCVAVGLQDGAVSMAQYTEAKLRDPRLHQFMQCIKVKEDGTFSNEYPRCSVTSVEAVDKAGRRYRAQASYTKGFPQDPMDEASTDKKFRDLTSQHLTPDQQSSALKWLWKLEEQRDLSELFRHLVIGSTAEGPVAATTGRRSG